MADLWWEFEEQDSFLLGRWVLQPDEFRMLEAFLTREQTENGKVPSFFFICTSPFESATSYASSLGEELKAQCLEPESLEDLALKGIDRHFIERISQTGWQDFLKQFHEQIQPIAGHMVVFLNPTQLEDAKSFQDWVMDQLEAGLNPCIRLMLADSAESSRFPALPKFASPHLYDLAPQLDMDAALQEIAAQRLKENPQDPGLQFQSAYAALLQSGAQGDLSAAGRYAQQGINLAQTNLWPHLVAACYLALGATQGQHQAYDAAYQSYALARTAAKQTQQDDEALGKRLGMQAWLGEGAARIMDQDGQGASDCYRQAAQLATEIPDHLMALEAWRMYGYSLQEQKRWIGSYEAYQQAIKHAQALPEGEAQHSTLAHAGHALIDLVIVKSGHGQKEKIQVYEALDKLLGVNWQEKPLTPTES